ncbi:uncharacterized protein LOC123297912 [Chrysoperla carnea]|uniref:uncharacterized protein LOC123297912 n=1 Tax=Chrysoperla carnea TaxID=189513 RepID=UPI001D08EBAD|nr:uncharacterized protein LOC123297912 [Chrysoperla carnea]
MTSNRNANKNSLKFVVYEDELSDYNDDSDGLEIDECPSPRKKKSLLQLDSNEKAVLENIDKEIDKQLEEKAANTNMSAQNVKNILKHIITNEQVLALVRNSANDEPFRTENLTFEPKLTRAKVKELFKNQAAPLRTNKSEIHVLIDQELPEDEEDDEYIPGEDESDDDQSTLVSDLDSQPATPATPSNSYSADCSTQTSWTDDGVFKVPTKVLKSPSVSISKPTQENIALRTRSKLSLSDTPLECIEQAFIPPDITTDMYDIECDDDDWRNFLKEFTLPLQAVTTATNEDDDEADPEYNILADEEIDAVDKEELRADRGVKVTKRELNDLVAELFDFADLFTPPCPNDETTENDSETQPAITENKPQNDKQEMPSTSQNNTTTEPETSQPILIEYPAVYSPCNVISKQQILLLEQQLRQHVQLLTQNFLQTYKHPIYNQFSENVKEMVTEIGLKAKKNPKSCLNAENLKNALKLMKFWEDKISSNDTDTQEMMKFVDAQIKRFITYKERKYTTMQPKLPPLLLQTISKSDVFMYPFLLPCMPFLPVVSAPSSNSNRIVYTLSEDSLIAIGLEQFISYLHAEKLVKNGKASIIDACTLIVRFLMPAKDFMSLRAHVLALKNGKKTDNPINYYFKHKVAPPTTHYVLPTYQCIPVNRQNKDILNEPWKSFIYPEPKRNSLDQIKPFLSDNSTQLRVPIPSPKLYSKSIRNRIPKRWKPKVKSPKYVKFKSIILKDTTPVKIIRNESISPSIQLKSKSPGAKLIANTFIMLPSMPGLSPFKQTPMKTSENIENCDEIVVVKESSSTSDINSDSNVCNEVAPTRGEKKLSKNIPENCNPEEKKGKDVETSTPTKGNCTLKTKPKITASEKKKAKQQKEYETVRALLSPESPKVAEEKANNFAHAYFNKVKERLTQNSPEDYNLFLATLSDHDESSDSVTDLYSKVTAILSPKHPDLCEEFITFLTPAQAKEIEKLIPYYMFSKMATFLRKLETYYNKQPAQIRKIYNSLVELSGQDGVNIDLVKTTILPLLKGNTYLIDYFLQIFSEEKPPQSLMTVWEDIDYDSTTSKNVEENVECFESLKVPDMDDPYGTMTCICTCHNSPNEEYSSRNRHCLSCGTKFIQGKVFIQTGKGPKPVSVTFPDCSMEEQNKRLCIAHKNRSKRRSEAVSPKSTPFSPSKHSHNEFDDDEHFGTKSNKNSPKKLTKSPKTNSSRKFSLIKSRKSDVRKGDKDEVKKGDMENNVSQKKYKSNLNFTKKDVPIKSNVKIDSTRTENDVDSMAITPGDNVDNENNKKIEKSDQEPTPMEWDDCNASVESIELKLSPNRSVESSDLCEESSQDLSEGNEDIPATCSESENDSIVEAESIHSDSSVSDNQEVTKQISFGWTRDEDKIILKTFQQECDSENKFDIIGELLPHRTIPEIRERFQTLMNLLLKITKSNM